MMTTTTRLDVFIKNMDDRKHLFLFIIIIIIILVVVVIIIIIIIIVVTIIITIFIVSIIIIIIIIIIVFSRGPPCLADVRPRDEHHQAEQQGEQCPILHVERSSWKHTGNSSSVAKAAAQYEE